MKYYLYLAALFIITVVMSCGKPQEQSEWKEINLKLNTVLTLPDSIHQQGSEVFFHHPDYVVTNEKGNIIVADRARNELLVFNKDGEFIDTIGQRGRGPGEFLKIKGMTINESGEILVFDSSSQMIKKFTSSGDYVTSHNLQTATVDIEFEHWKHNNILFYLKDLPADSDPNYMLHAYSPSFQLIGEDISYRELEFMDQDLLVSYVASTGNSHFIQNDTLYFAPTLYNGLIYQYEIKQDANQQITLRLKNKTQGHTFIKKPAERFNGENLPYADATITMASGRKLQTLLYNQSKGLYQLNNGVIVHFTYIEKEEPRKRVFGVEVYDKTMKPIGYAPFKEIFYDPDRSNMLSWNVIWKDAEDRFYIVDKDSDGPPAIRVVTLEGLEEYIN
ncbi:MAG: 6-bladed beta-propeller [Balneolaceae bacterium]|nr:6-bladed beta-propeller [Balneolaceae bacterium]